MGDLETWSMGGSDQTININGSFIPRSGFSIVHTFNVKEDVYIQNGASLGLNRNMTVNGDFRIQSKDANGNFGATTGWALINAGAKLTVYGDFYTQSTTNQWFGNSNNTANLAVFELHGNFTQIGTTTCFHHRNESAFKTIFAGDGEQRISFDRFDSLASLGMIEVINASQTIYLDSPTHRIHLLSSINIIGDVTVNEFTSNNQTVNIDGSLNIKGTSTTNTILNVTGDCIIEGNVTFNGGQTTVYGDLHVRMNRLIMQDEVVVFGDFRIQSKDSDGNFGITNSFAQLRDNAKLRVYGDFYTQTTNNIDSQSATTSTRFSIATTTSTLSVLELHGNFYQIGANTFFAHRSENQFKIVFAGDGEQRISFDRFDSFASLGRIEVTNASQTIYLDTPIWNFHALNSFNIIGDLETLSMGGSDCTINISGSFIPRGNFTINNFLNITGDTIIDSNVTLNRNMKIGGDLRIQRPGVNGVFGQTAGRFAVNSGVNLVILGSMYTQTISAAINTFGNSTVANPSTLELHGNLYQIGENTRFTHTSGHITVFAGDGEQRILFENFNSNANLGRIEVLNASQTIYLDSPIHTFHPLNSFTVIGDLETWSMGGSDQTINVNGSFIPRASMTVNNFLNITGSAIIDNSVTLNRNMKIGGDFRIQRPGANGTFGATTGQFSLGAGVNLAVLGNFYTQTTSTTNFGSGTAANPAVLELQGNFHQIGTNTNFRHVANGFRLVLSGTNNQYISFDNYNQSNLGRLSKTNANNIYFLTPILSLTAESDMAIAMSSDARIGTLNLGGHVVHLKTPAVLTTVNLGGGVLICNENITLGGAFNFNGGLVNARKNVTVNTGGSLNMTSDNDALIIQGDLILNTTSNVTLSRGFLDLGGNLTLNNAISFTTGTNFYAQLSGGAGQHISYPQNGTVRFGILAFPDLDPQRVLVTRGNTTRYLDLRLVNGTCNNANCTFTSCHSHEFPTLSCSAWLWCDSETCTFATNGRTCSSCVRCVVCTTCSNDRIFTNVGSEILNVLPVVEQIKTRFFGISGIHSPTGNYSQSFTDMTVPTVLGDLTFTRTYNSLNSNVSNVGRGFSFSYDMNIVIDGNMRYVMLPNGSVWTFEGNGSTFIAKDSRGTLRRQGSDYILETLDQMRYVFNSSGHIRYVEDFKGNRVTINTGANGRITSLTDPSGASVTFGYTGNQLTRITDNKSGRTVSYTYNGNLLTQVTDAAGMTTAYSYTNNLLTGINDNSGRRVLTLTYLNSEGKVHTVTDVTGNTRTYSYDPINMRTGITDSNGRTTYEGYGFDYAVTTSTNELGLTTRVSYLLINGENLYNEVQSATDMYGNTTRYDRDSRGNIIRITYPDGSAESFTFDLNNNRTSYTDRTGAVTWYIYDGFNLTREVRPLDGVSAYSTSANQNNYAITTFTYYPNNQTTRNGSVRTVTPPTGDVNNYILYEYNSYGEISAMTRYINGVPFTTNYIYDTSHRITRQTNPDRTRTDYVYNQAGQVVKATVTSPCGNIVSVSENVYDNLGRVIREITPTGSTTHYFYNTAGFVSQQIDPLGNSTFFEYDFYGNVTKQTLANGSYNLVTYDALNRKLTESFYDSVTGRLTLLEETCYSSVNRSPIVTSTIHIDNNLSATTVERYSFEGNLLERTTPNGARFTYTYVNGRLMNENIGFLSSVNYEYDAWGNVTRTLSSFNSSSQAETLFTYDRAGNMTSQRVRNNLPGQADSFRRTDFTYDAWGRNTEIVYYDNGIEMSNVSFVYDWADRVTEQHKGANSVVGFVYDHIGNIVQKTDALGQIETFAYDIAGRPVQSIDRNGTVHAIVYDIIGNPISKTSNSSTDFLSKTYTYDALGNMLSVNDGSDIITYTYDGRGNRLTETRGNTHHIYTYNNLGALLTSQILIGGQVQQNVRYEYNNIGRIARVFEDNHPAATYTYDVLGRQVRVRNGNGTTQVTRYNAAGLVTSVLNTRGTSVISEYSYTYYLDGNQHTKTEAAGITTYFYDGLNRLETAVLHDGTVQNYEFDANGNRTKMTVTTESETAVTTYTYDANDRIISRTIDGETETFTYDANGNMLTRGNIVQTFDLLNRMTSWTDGTTNAVYTYNPDNMRRAKTVNNVTTEHVWLGANIALDRTAGDVVSYIHNVKSDYGWHVFNAHGDVVQLTDDHGFVIRRYDYDPFGNQLTDNSECLNPFRYNNQYYDSETGYVYLRHRYYDTSLGRFINEDPIFDGWNWYVYGNNNPLMFSDPSGLNALLIAEQGIKYVEKGIKYAEKALAWLATTAVGITAIELVGANIDSFIAVTSSLLGGKVATRTSPTAQIGVILDINIRFEPSLLPPPKQRKVICPIIDSKPQQREERNTLYHYTNLNGLAGILYSGQILPSLGADNPRDARYGDGQYFSDISPWLYNPRQLASRFINVPNDYRFTHFIEIDITGLNIERHKNGVFVHPSQEPLCIINRVESFGQVGW
jgi:RHS repeat-associated protein